LHDYKFGKGEENSDVVFLSFSYGKIRYNPSKPLLQNPTNPKIRKIRVQTNPSKNNPPKSDQSQNPKNPSSDNPTQHKKARGAAPDCLNVLLLDCIFHGNPSICVIRGSDTPPCKKPQNIGTKCQCFVAFYLIHLSIMKYLFLLHLSYLYPLHISSMRLLSFFNSK
jgi:hypothetical protein